MHNQGNLKQFLLGTQRPIVLTRLCGVPSRGGRTNPTSSETLVAYAEAKLEEGREVGAGLAELQLNLQEKSPSLAGRQSPRAPQRWQPKPLVWFSSRHELWSIVNVIFNFLNRRVDSSAE